MINLKQIYMNKILVILSLFILACSNNATRVEANNEREHEQHDTSATALQLNNGARWKTDEATRRNVAEMVKLINDSSNIGKENIAQLSQHLQTRIDSLVQECKMKGPDHDALHIWLEQVLHDLKRVKKEANGDYQTSYAALKQDIERFYVFFE